MDPPAVPSKQVDRPKSDNESLKSEVDGRTIDGGFISIFVILQTLCTLGMSSVNAWCTCVANFKKYEEIRKDPFAMNLVFTLSSFAQILEQHIHLTAGPSQKHLVDFEHEVKPYEEIIKILKPALNKKPHKGITFAIETVQKITGYVNSFFTSIPSENKRKSNKQTKPKHVKKGKRSSYVSSYRSTSSFSLSSSGSSSSSSSYESDFEDLFEKPKKVPVVVSQEITYRNKNERTEIYTPDEQGSHLIKTEITIHTIRNPFLSVSIGRGLGRRVYFYSSHPILRNLK